jgi:predicted hydrocarbon binding protein
MVASEKSLYWNKERGSLHLVHGETEQRVFMMRKGFMDSFFDEILNVEGKDALSMTVRMILEKIGAQSADADKPTIDTLNRLTDDRVLPLSISPDEQPAMFTRSDSTREFLAFGSVVYLLEMSTILNAFKEVSAQILTPRGARAIIRTVGRRAGHAVGDSIRATYGMTDMDTTMAALDMQYKVVFPLLGWGHPSVTSAKAPDGNQVMLVRFRNTFESDGFSSAEPVCNVVASFFEGISESVALSLTGKAAEGREVRCASMGDGYCAFAVKTKEKGSPALDWSAIENEWRALDT